MAIPYDQATIELSRQRAALGDLNYYTALYNLQWVWSGLNTWQDAMTAYPQGAKVSAIPFSFPKPPPVPGYLGFPVDAASLLRTYRAIQVLRSLTKRGVATGAAGYGSVSPSAGAALKTNPNGTVVLTKPDGSTLITSAGTPIIVITPIAPVPLTAPQPPRWVWVYLGYSYMGQF